jgi:hypothetical protein
LLGDLTAQAVLLAAVAKRYFFGPTRAHLEQAHDEVPLTLHHFPGAFERLEDLLGRAGRGARNLKSPAARPTSVSGIASAGSLPSRARLVSKATLYHTRYVGNPNITLSADRGQRPRNCKSAIHEIGVEGIPRAVHAERVVFGPVKAEPCDG